MLLLGEIVRRHARVRPAKTAYAIGSARVTYGEFHAESNRLAHALRAVGVQRGDRVAVLANNCRAYPVIYFGCVKLGAIVVPVNARFRDDEMRYVIEHSQAATVLFGAQFSEAAERLRPHLPAVATWRCIDDRQWPAWLQEHPAEDIDAVVDERDPHVMLYTSGTTGQPKGALLSHRSYVLQAANAHHSTGLGEEDIGLSMFPMFHMGGWALPLGFWYDGGTVVIMEQAEARAMLQAIARERVTYLYAVPTVYTRMLDLLEREPVDVSSLRVIASGTAVMTEAQIRRIMAGFRNDRVFVVYGSTEAGPVAMLRPADVLRKSTSVGRPALNVEVCIVDEHDAEVAPGQAGEIVCRSEFNMLGYWRMPEESAAALRGGWLHTGDLGVIDADGFLSIAGRKKEMIKSGGENIFPAEVERVLLTHPAVAEAAVFGVPDAEWDESVVAAVVPRDGAGLDGEAVIAHVRERLAGYKKPRYVWFVDHLPRTAATRQVQKTLLREQFLLQRDRRS